MNPRITLVGRIGKTPERHGSGATFRVVTSDAVKTESGQWEDRNVSWWTVKAWSHLADQTRILDKGQEVMITGTISQNDWTDREGNTRSSYDVVADTIAVTTFTLTKKPKNNSPFEESMSESPWN